MTARAVLQRINRKLLAKADGDVDSARQVRRSRGRAKSFLGEYYLLDVRRNFIADQNVDLEGLGRDLGVLEKWEVLADER